MASPEYVKSANTDWEEAIVVHLIADHLGKDGETLKLCNGEYYDVESTSEMTNRRVFCQLCKRLAERI